MLSTTFPPFSTPVSSKGSDWSSPALTGRTLPPDPSPIPKPNAKKGGIGYHFYTLPRDH